jgi:hypothetical protein
MSSRNRTRETKSGNNNKDILSNNEERKETQSSSLLSKDLGSSRHQKVVGFFKSVWQHHDLSVQEQSAPAPSDHAKAQTREEAVAWHTKLKGSPLLHSRRFFLVEYGIELLEEERVKREMHVSLLGYTSFVLIFLLYVFTNVPVADTYATQTAIHDAVVDRPWIVTNSTKDTSHDVLRNTLRQIEKPADVWEWLLYGFTNLETSSNTGPFSPTRRIADWNVVLGAVRLRQIRLKNTNCEVGKTKITSSLDIFAGTDCHGTATVSAIETAAFGPGTIKNMTTAPMIERSVTGQYRYQSASDLAYVLHKDGITKIPILNAPSWGIEGNYGVYDYGGYVIDLPAGDVVNAHDIIQQLQLDQWLDDATAGLVVSFTTYNPNLNMFTYNRILLEYTGTGLVKLLIVCRPFQMPALFNQFQKSDDQSQVAFITYLFMINVFGWLAELLWRGCKSCTSPDPSNKFDVWGWIDLFNLILLSVQLGERIVWELTFNEIKEFSNYAGGSYYYDFEQLSWWFEFERILAYINTLTVFLKYMKLMRLSPRLSLLVKVVYAAGQYVISWFVVAACLLIGYIFMGYILFGAQLSSFSTISKTTITLFNYIVGQFNNYNTGGGGDNVQPGQQLEIYDGSGFESLQYAGLNQDVLFFASPTFFFLSFNLIFYLFLMRVMVAIFVTAYTEVSREIERNERKNHELSRTHKETLKHLSKSFNTSACGWFLNAYIFSGIISCFPEPPSEKHILHALKAEPELINKGYLDYNELEMIIREAFASNPTKCCGYTCGRKRIQPRVRFFFRVLVLGLFLFRLVLLKLTSFSFSFSSSF